MFIQYVADSVDDDDGTDLQLADLDGVHAEAGLHHAFRAAELAHRRAGSCAVIAFANHMFLRFDAGRIAHSRIRADVVAASQVKNARRYDKGDVADARRKADTLLFQILHDPAGGVQTEGAAAA